MNLLVWSYNVMTMDIQPLAGYWQPDWVTGRRRESSRSRSSSLASMTWVFAGSSGRRENSQSPTLLVWKRRTRGLHDPVAH